MSRPAFVRRIAATLGAAFILGCSSTGTSGPNVSGSWSGAAATVSLDMNLTQAGQAVSGSGSLVVDSSAYGVSISGSLIDSNVALTLTAGGYQPVAYAATLSGTKMSGSLSGSGFPGSSLTVTRQ